MSRMSVEEEAIASEQSEDYPDYLAMGGEIYLGPAWIILLGAATYLILSTIGGC